MIIFTDVMEPGIQLVERSGHLVPDFLEINDIQHITLEDRLNPASLPPSTAIIYDQNLYLTDGTGNIAFIDCELRRTTPTSHLRLSHPEYRAVSQHGRDAGHIGLSLGQHPSIAMEQNKYMNRWGIWRLFEQYWTSCIKKGKRIRLIGVFVEGEDTYSPFWCIHEEMDDDIIEYIFTNDDEP